MIGAGLGFAVGYWQGIRGEQPGPRLALDDRAPLEQRLSEIETSLALERYERQALAEELANLRDSGAAQPASGFGDDAGSDPLTERVPEGYSDDVSKRREEIDWMLRQQQFDRFVAAGLSAAQAHAIMQREDEIEMDALRARYAATQSGATPQEVARITPLALLRTELGDSVYAQYLDARGRANSVRVRNILVNSPAGSAGLQSGDEIIAYDGQRVFDMNELTSLTLRAKTGTTVPLEVIRNGQSIQIYVDAGPIGINDGGRP